MAAGLTQVLTHQLLNLVFRNQAYTAPTAWYVSLHTANPGESGTNEVTGGSYARQSVTFNAAAALKVENAALATFTSMPAVTITHAAVWDSLSGGTLLAYGSLTTARSLSLNASVELAAQDLDINVSQS